MKKVIEHGFMNHLETTCPYCGCRFSYEVEDLMIKYDTRASYDISCPECAKAFPVINWSMTIPNRRTGTTITYTTTSADTCTTGCTCDKCSHRND